MLSHTELDRLLGAMRATGTTELRVASGSHLLELVLAPAPVRNESVPVAPTAASAARSPAIGLWQGRGQDDGLPPLLTGEKATEGEVLGYVRQGVVLWPVAAPAGGVLVDTGPEDDTLLGHGDPILQIQGAQ
ncbi:MAG: hypothetical protein WAK98_09880 [Gemmobacter sp.]|jgi:hypothetical protein